MATGRNPSSAADPNGSSSQSQPSGSATVPNSSWADRVRVTNSTSKFTLPHVKHTLTGDSPIIDVPSALLDKGSLVWKHCIVGFFPGCKMSFLATKSIAFRVWRTYGLVSVLSSGNYFFFRFQDDAGVHSVLTDGPWLFGGKHILLQEWSSYLTSDDTKITKVPVWIRLYGLPFMLMSHEGMGFAASVVGRPLTCDQSTYELTRLDYVRVCVELDAERPPLHKFHLQLPGHVPLAVEVEYEWKPKRCPQCCVFGHFCQPPPAAPEPPPASMPASSSDPPEVATKTPEASLQRASPVVAPDSPSASAAMSASTTPLPRTKNPPPESSKAVKRGAVDSPSDDSSTGSPPRDNSQALIPFGDCLQNVEAALSVGLSECLPEAVGLHSDAEFPLLGPPLATSQPVSKVKKTRKKGKR